MVGRLRRKVDKAANATGRGLTVLWHWAILLLAVVGLSFAIRVIPHAVTTAQDSGQVAEQVIWWVIAGALGLMALVFVREMVWRIMALRARRGAAAPEHGKPDLRQQR